jgi:hypothetical protein
MLLGNTTRRLLSCGLVQNSKIYKFLMRLRIRLQQEKFSATRVLQQQVLLKRWKQHKIWHHWIKATIKHTYSFFPEKNNIGKAVPGSLDKKEGRRFYLLLSKMLQFLPPFLFTEPGTGPTKNLTHTHRWLKKSPTNCVREIGWRDGSQWLCQPRTISLQKIIRKVTSFVYDWSSAFRSAKFSNDSVSR